MKNLYLLVLLLSCSGCAHQYVMKLTNGMKISTPSKPKLRGSTYYFKDAKGQEQSMAAEDNKFQVTPPKKKHWYWPF
jgi:hypothetical protein